MDWPKRGETTVMAGQQAPANVQKILTAALQDYYF